LEPKYCTALFADFAHYNYKEIKNKKLENPELAAESVGIRIPG